MSAIPSLAYVHHDMTLYKQSKQAPQRLKVAEAESDLIINDLGSTVFVDVPSRPD